MISDEGMRFHAILQKADGSTATRETDNRLELLEWVALHQRHGDTVIEVGTSATGTAVQNMLSAMTLGALAMQRARS